MAGGDTVAVHLAATTQLAAGSPDQFVFAYSTDGVYVVRAVDLSGNLSDSSDEVWVTVAEIPAEQFVSVSSVTVILNVGKKYSAVATVAVTPALAGAVVTDDWYFEGVIMRQNTVTGTTTDSGVATFITPFETPAKSGDLFTFVVTSVAAGGYTYDPGANDATEDSAAVP